MQTAMQEVEFGKMTAQGRARRLQQVRPGQRLAKAKQENPDWYAAGD